MIKKIALLFTFIITLNTTTHLHAKSDFTMYAVIFTMGILIGAVLMNIYLQTNTLNNHLDDSSQQKNSVSVSVEPKVFTIAHAMHNRWSLIIENSLKVTINITPDANRLETSSTEQPLLEASDTEIKIYRPTTCITNSFNTAKNKPLECSLFLTENDFNNIYIIHASNGSCITFSPSAKKTPIKMLWNLTAQNNTKIEEFFVNNCCNLTATDNSTVTIEGTSKANACIHITNNSVFNAGKLLCDTYNCPVVKNKSTVILNTRCIPGAGGIDKSSMVTINKNDLTERITEYCSVTFYEQTPPTLIPTS